MPEFNCEVRYQPVIEAAENGSTGEVELSKSFLEDINVIILSGSVAKKFSEFVEPIALSVAKRESENEQSSNGEAEFRFRESVTHCS